MDEEKKNGTKTLPEIHHDLITTKARLDAVVALLDNSEYWKNQLEIIDGIKFIVGDIGNLIEKSGNDVHMHPAYYPEDQVTA